MISSSLSKKQVGKLLDVLRNQREAIGLTILDFEEISSIVCKHHIEDDLREAYLLDTIGEEPNKDHMS